MPIHPSGTVSSCLSRTMNDSGNKVSDSASSARADLGDKGIVEQARISTRMHLHPIRTACLLASIAFCIRTVSPLHDYRIGNIRFSKISIIISTLMSRLALPMSCPVAQRTCFELARNHPTSATLTHRCSCFSRGGASSGFAGLASIRRVSLVLPGFAGFRVKRGWKLRFLAAG